MHHCSAHRVTSYRRFTRAQKTLDKAQLRVDGLKRDEEGLKRKFTSHGIGFDFGRVRAIQVAAAHLATAVMMESDRSAPLHNSQAAWEEAAANAAAAAAAAAGGGGGGSPSSVVGGGGSVRGGGGGGGGQYRQSGEFSDASPSGGAGGGSVGKGALNGGFIPASEVFAAAAAAARLRLSSDDGGGGAAAAAGGATGTRAAVVADTSPLVQRGTAPADSPRGAAGSPLHAESTPPPPAAAALPRLPRWSVGAGGPSLGGGSGAVAAGVVSAAAASEHLASVFKFAFRVHQFAGGLDPQGSALFEALSGKLFAAMRMVEQQQEQRLAASPVGV